MDLHSVRSVTSSFLYLAISLSLAAVFSIYFPHYFSSWLFFIVILFLLAPYVPGVQSGISMKVMMALLVISSLCISSWINLSPVLLVTYLAILTSASVFAREYYPLYAWPIFISSVMVIVLKDVSHIYDVLLAFAIVILMQVVMMASEKRLERQQYFYNYVHELKQLVCDLFDCFLDPDYSHNIYIFERRLHRQKMKCLRLGGELQTMLAAIRRHQQRADEQKQLIFLESIYQHLQNIAILRWRVTDYTAFSLCLQELKGVVGEVELCLDGVWQKPKGPDNQSKTTALTYWIRRLDDNYHNVLQVAAREPLVFALFIDGLFSMRDAIDDFYDGADKS